MQDWATDDGPGRLVRQRRGQPPLVALRAPARRHRDLTDAWQRRDIQPVVMVRYADLVADLVGEMGRLATRLGFDHAPATIAAELLSAADLRRYERRVDGLASRDLLAWLRSAPATIENGGM